MQPERTILGSRMRDDAAILALLLGVCSCSLDQRKLHLGEDDTAGAPSNGGSEHAGSSGTGGMELPSGGSGGSGQGLVDGCADLDTDGVADCESTLVETPSFTEDVVPWVAVGDAALIWDESNALADSPSGSAKLRTNGPRATAIQCVKLSGQHLVIAYASTFAASSDEAITEGLLEVSFFSTVDCTGKRDGFFETPPSSESDAWTTVQAGGVSGPNTASVSVGLVGVNPRPPADLTVYFDNVMLRAQDVPEE